MYVYGYRNFPSNCLAGHRNPQPSYGPPKWLGILSFHCFQFIFEIIWGLGRYQCSTFTLSEGTILIIRKSVCNSTKQTKNNTIFIGYITFYQEKDEFKIVSSHEKFFLSLKSLPFSLFLCLQPFNLLC